MVAGLGWLAVDLYRTGRLVGHSRRAHLSLLVLIASLGVWVLLPLDAVAARGGGRAMVVGGVVAVVAMAVMAEADRGRMAFLIPGRALMVLGATIIGVGALFGVVGGGGQVYVAGLTMLGLAAAAVAAAEARLVALAVRYVFG